MSCASAVGRDPERLDRFRELCGRLGPGPRVVVTHYPLRTATGKIEVRTHRLRDHKTVLAAAKEAGISLWLHGHIHRGFVLHPTADIPFQVSVSSPSSEHHRP